ncbi:MAG: L,D-transpeptidase [Pseudomonadota bacterium]
MFNVSFRAAALTGAAMLAAVSAAPTAATAGVTVRIDISAQRANVYVNGARRHSWRISSGRRGYYTPRGSYRPTRMHRMWYSRKYNMSPMPHSIFFRGGYAIHGTYAVRKLGRPASHGCIRLAPSAARRLFGLVRRYGARRTRIVITN